MQREHLAAHRFLVVQIRLFELMSGKIDTQLSTVDIGIGPWLPFSLI